MQRQAGGHWKRRIQRTFLGAAATLIAVVYYQWVNNNVNPEPHVPHFPHIKPNARDYDLRAAELIMESSRVTDACAHPRAYSLTDKSALLQANRAALETMRAGFAFPYQEPFDYPYDPFFRHLDTFRSLACLSALEGESAASRGDWDRAVNAYLDVIELGQDMPNGGTLTGMVLGDDIEAMGNEGAERAAAHLDAAQARAAARRMESIIARREPFLQTLTMHKYYGQVGIYQMFHRTQWRGRFTDLFAYNPHERGSQGGQIRARLRLYYVNKRQAMANYTRWMDFYIERAKRPFGTDIPTLPAPKDPITPPRLPHVAAVWRKDAAQRARNARLALDLALRAYKMEHGAYPAALTLLLPDALSRLPDALEMPGRSFQYVPKAGGYRLAIPYLPAGM